MVDLSETEKFGGLDSVQVVERARKQSRESTYLSV